MREPLLNFMYHSERIASSVGGHAQRVVCFCWVRPHVKGPSMTATHCAFSTHGTFRPVFNLLMSLQLSELILCFPAPWSL